MCEVQWKDMKQVKSFQKRIQVEVWVELDNTNTHDGKYLTFLHFLSLHPLLLCAGFISSTSEHPISHVLFVSKIDTATIQLSF